MKELLKFQLGGSFRLLMEVCDSAVDTEWTARPFPGANLLGFTVWHGARTMDWAVNGVLRGRPELAALKEWADLKVPGAMFGAGASREAADRVAATVPRARVRDYLAALNADTVSWFDKLPEAELSEATDLRRADPAYTAEQVWSEVEDLDGIPKWQFLARPCVSHVRVHYGEAMGQLEAMRARA